MRYTILFSFTFDNLIIETITEMQIHNSKPTEPILYNYSLGNCYRRLREMPILRVFS